MAPSSLGGDWPTAAPDDAAIIWAAEILNAGQNAGQKVAILAGSGARAARLRTPPGASARSAAAHLR